MPKSKEPHAPRNEELVGGVMRFSRARMYAVKGIYKKKPFKPVKKVNVKKERTVEKQIGGDKNGGTRIVLKERRPRSYVTEKTMRPALRKKKAPRPAKLRSSLKPGTVVILLTSAHKGKRCVFLKQLPSGLLLVTGPMPLNGCPLRRVDQTHVIATSLKLDISKVKIPDHLTDEYFRRVKADRRKPKEVEGDIFAAKKQVSRKKVEEYQGQHFQKYEVSEKRKEDQRAVDTALMGVVTSQKEKTLIRDYLATPFGLRKGQFPHKMVF